MSVEVVAAAAKYVDLGFEILPVRTDGSKAPAAPTWSGDTTGEFSPEDVDGRGIGIKCGALSDNLVVFDFESTPAFREFSTKVKEVGCAALIESAGVAISPRPGRHMYVHLDERPSGSTVLALDENGKTLIEVRAQGAYIVAPGSPKKCHKSGKPYLWVKNPPLPENRRYLTAAEYELLESIAASLDKSGMHEKPKSEKIARQPVPEGRNQPGDHFNRDGSIGSILTKHGFSLLTTKRDGTECWQKPNSSDPRQHQLTYNAPECPQRLFCFSSSCPPFEQGASYDHFSVYALLEHEGDFKAAAKQLAKDGFGERPAKTPPSTDQAEPEAAEREWMTPVLFDQINTPEIPTSLFPSPLSEYLHAVAESVQVPEGMVTMVALAVLATCAQKRFEVHVTGKYSEPLSLWTLTALPPASRKTAVLDELRKPIVEWERAQSIEMAASISDYEDKKEINELRVKELQRQAAKEHDQHERLALVKEISDLKKELGPPISAPRLWTDDTTPERLQGLMADHGERMALVSDEGGIFELMAGLYSDGKANVDVFLKSHAGSAVRVDRASRTVHLQKPALTFGLTVQPAVVGDLCSGDKRRFRGNGLLARFLYCLPVSNIGSRDVLQQKETPSELFYRYDALIRDLLSIPARLDPSGTEIARQLNLSPDALDALKAFASEIEKKQGAGGEYEDIQDWTGKLPGAVARIAGLFHLAQYGAEAEQHCNLNADTMTSAVKLGALLIPHAQAAFESMILDRAVADAKVLYKWIVERGEPSFRQTEAHRSKSRFKNNKIDRLMQALDVLITRNIISGQEKIPTRKPTLLYWVNPVVLNMVQG